MPKARVTTAYSNGRRRWTVGTPDHSFRVNLIMVNHTTLDFKPKSNSATLMGTRRGINKGIDKVPSNVATKRDDTDARNLIFEALPNHGEIVE